MIVLYHKYMNGFVIVNFLTSLPVIKPFFLLDQLIGCAPQMPIGMTGLALVLHVALVVEDA